MNLAFRCVNNLSQFWGSNGPSFQGLLPSHPSPPCQQTECCLWRAGIMSHRCLCGFWAQRIWQYVPPLDYVIVPFKGYPYMGVSLNGGTPKSSILIGVSIINHPFWGTTILGNPHIYSTKGSESDFLFKYGATGHLFIYMTSWSRGAPLLSPTKKRLWLTIQQEAKSRFLPGPSLSRKLLQPAVFLHVGQLDPWWTIDWVDNSTARTLDTFSGKKHWIRNSWNMWLDTRKMIIIP